MLVFDTDPARARQAARVPLSFLSGVGGYRANFARMGFTDRDVADLSDRLVDELVVWGGADQIAAAGSASTWTPGGPGRAHHPELRRPARPLDVARNSPAGFPADLDPGTPGLHEGHARA